MPAGPAEAGHYIGIVSWSRHSRTTHTERMLRSFGGVGRRRSTISFRMSAEVSGYSTADCTPTRTRVGVVDRLPAMAARLRMWPCRCRGCRGLSAPGRRRAGPGTPPRRCAPSSPRPSWQPARCPSLQHGDMTFEQAVKRLRVTCLSPDEEVRSRVDVVHRLGALVRHVSGNAVNDTSGCPLRLQRAIRNHEIVAVAR